MSSRSKSLSLSSIFGMPLGSSCPATTLLIHFLFASAKAGSWNPGAMLRFPAITNMQ